MLLASGLGPSLVQEYEHLSLSRSPAADFALDLGTATPLLGLHDSDPLDRRCAIAPTANMWSIIVMIAGSRRGSTSGRYSLKRRCLWCFMKFSRATRSTRARSAMMRGSPVPI